MLCGAKARTAVFEIDNQEELLRMEKSASILKSDLRRIGRGKYVRFTSPSNSDNIRYVKHRIADINMTLRIIDTNLEETIKEVMKRNVLKRATTQKVADKAAKIETYFASHDSYNQWFKTLKEENPRIITLQYIGKSYEGREMIVLRLSTGEAKEAIFLEGGAHAREWLSITSVVWILKKMINNLKSGDIRTKAVINRFDIFFLPVSNPDGYERTRLGGKNRSWRKNMMPVKNGCQGVDLNRNFDVDFANSSYSSDPCDILYPGSKPFDAPESRNFRNFVLLIKHYLKLFISFHAYGQLLLTPWAYQTALPPDHEEMTRVANIMADTIFNFSRVPYRVGTAAELVYSVSGTSFDWVKKLGVKYSYAIEVRPFELDDVGFLAPIEIIKPNGEELYEALLAAAKTLI